MTTKTKAAPKLDIFETMKAADLKNRDFYTNLEPEQQKGYAPFLLTRWMSGTSDARQVIMLNEVVNPFVFALSRHPELLWKLTTICTSGKQKRYNWNKTAGKNVAYPQATQVLIDYCEYSVSQAVDAVSILEPQTIIDMAEDMGWQDTEVNKVREELGLKVTKTRAPKQTRKKK